MGPRVAIGTVALSLAALAVRGSPPNISPADTIPEYLARQGIHVEEHFTTTEDGYILRLFRLPHPGAPAVLLQHGILCSAWVWLVNVPERSLGIVLWKLGYDVWLTNNRGNMFSRNHTHLRPLLDVAFWDFTFDDMGKHDVVSNVQHVLNETKKDSLVYVGWSQGTTQMFIGSTFPENKDYLEKHVSLFVALSPVAYLESQSSILLGTVSKFRLGAILSVLWPFGIFDLTELPTIAQWLCNTTHGVLCKIGVDTVCGISDLDDPGAIANLAAHFPAGTSTKDMNHYEQLINSKSFRRYDYGRVGNLVRYKRFSPPDYPLKDLGLKTALFVGTADDLGDPTDVGHLVSDLKENDNIVFKKNYDGYSHVTWFTGTTWAWFEDLKQLLAQYSPRGEELLI